MFDQSIKKHLQEGEVVVLLLRSSLLSRPIKLLMGAVLLLAPFFFLFPLLRYREWGVLVFLCVLAIAFYYILRLYVLWQLNVFIVTNRRIIDVDQRGIFSRRVSELSFAKIQDIRYNRVGIFATLLNLGDVMIQSASREELSIHGVRKPETVKDAIMKIQEKFNRSLSQNQPLTAEELVQFIGRIKRYLRRSDA